jgi:dipeptidase D
VEPTRFWEHFEAITKIPRPSREEGQIIEHVRAWAAAHGYELEQDHGRNLVVRVPATPGRQDAPTVILQAHLDMVCERDPDSPNDPAKGRVELVRDGDWIAANGTTLGADNGVGIAAMMALVEDESVPHGPLELLMTVAEEVGLEGVNHLDGSLLTGTILVNLDGHDGALTVGCAGSADTWLVVDGERAACDVGAVTLTLTASGGLGGHSGADIHLGRANAVKALGRVLREARAAAPFRLVSLEGGRSRNAIPRDAAAVVSVAPEREADFRSAVESSTATLRRAYAKTDPRSDVTVSEGGDAPDAWTPEATEKLLDVAAVVPSGPLGMTPGFPGLIETSSSLSEALTDAGRLTLHSLSRSSNDDALLDVVGTLEAAARLVGGRLEVLHNHAGWLPDLDSPVLAVAGRLHEELFGSRPEITGVHGGLEPAVIGAKVPGLDMLSIGPGIEGMHAPGERLNIPSVERFWRLTTGLLDELGRPPAS